MQTTKTTVFVFGDENMFGWKRFPSSASCIAKMENRLQFSALLLSEKSSGRDVQHFYSSFCSSVASIFWISHFYILDNLRESLGEHFKFIPINPDYFFRSVWLVFPSAKDLVFSVSGFVETQLWSVHPTGFSFHLHQESIVLQMLQKCLT